MVWLPCLRARLGRGSGLCLCSTTASPTAPPTTKAALTLTTMLQPQYDDVEQYGDASLPIVPAAGSSPLGSRRLRTAPPLRMDTNSSGEEQQGPHVAVIGAGLVGLTSAHSLASRGYQVTVIDRQPHVANECSFANAGLLMSSYSRPKTATIRQLLRWATTREEPVHVSARAMCDPAMLSFGLRFLLSGPQTEQRIFETTQVSDALTSASIAQLDAIRDELGMQTRSLDGGLLMVFADEAKLRAMREESEASFAPDERESRFRVVSAADCVALEPALSHRAHELVGGVYWPKDRTICPLAFSQELAASLQQRGASFALGEEAVALRPPPPTQAQAQAPPRGGGAKTLLELASGRALPVDAVVVAAGVGSGHVLRTLGGAAMPAAPLYGMRGHSLTVDVSHLPGSGRHEHVLRQSLCDGDTMAFFSPLLPAPGSERRLLRIAAFGDFDGWDYGPQAVRPWRQKQLLAAARTALGFGVDADVERAPLAASALGPSLCPEADPATQWSGLRPMSPDGLPMLGYAGSGPDGCKLFLNAGHGALGWTLSGGCAELLGEAVAAQLPPPLAAPPAPMRRAPEALRRLASELSPSRFGWGEVLRRGWRMRLGQSVARALPALARL